MDEVRDALFGDRPIASVTPPATPPVEGEGGLEVHVEPGLHGDDGASVVHDGSDAGDPESDGLWDLVDGVLARVRGPRRAGRPRTRPERMVVSFACLSEAKGEREHVGVGMQDFSLAERAALRAPSSVHALVLASQSASQVCEVPMLEVRSFQGFTTLSRVRNVVCSAISLLQEQPRYC